MKICIQSEKYSNFEPYVYNKTFFHPKTYISALKWL